MTLAITVRFMIIFIDGSTVLIRGRSALFIRKVDLREVHKTDQRGIHRFDQSKSVMLMLYLL